MNMATNTFTTRDLRLRGWRSRNRCVCVCVQWAKQPKTTTGHKGGNGAQRVAHKQRTQQCNTCSKPSTMATTTTPLGGGQCVVVCVMAMPHMPHVPQQWVAAGGVWWCGGVVLCHGGGVWWHRRCLWLWLGVCHMATRPNASRTMPNTCSNTALSCQDSSAASSSPRGWVVCDQVCGRALVREVVHHGLAAHRVGVARALPWWRSACALCRTTSVLPRVKVCGDDERVVVLHHAVPPHVCVVCAWPRGGVAGAHTGPSTQTRWCGRGGAWCALSVWRWWWLTCGMLSTLNAPVPTHHTNSRAATPALHPLCRRTACVRGVCGQRVPHHARGSAPSPTSPTRTPNRCTTRRATPTPAACKHVVKHTHTTHKQHQHTWSHGTTSAW